MAYSISDVFFTKYSNTLLLSVTHAGLDAQADLSKTQMKWNYHLGTRKSDFVAGCKGRLDSGTTTWLTPCGTNGTTQTFIIDWSNYSRWDYYYADFDEDNSGTANAGDTFSVFFNASGPVSYTSSIPSCLYDDWQNWNAIGGSYSHSVTVRIYNSSSSKIQEGAATANAKTFYNGTPAYISRANVTTSTNWQTLESSTSACSAASIQGQNAAAYGDPHISPLFGKKYII